MGYYDAIESIIRQVAKWRVNQYALRILAIRDFFVKAIWEGETPQTPYALSAAK
jgi:hypothetical protein